MITEALKKLSKRENLDFGLTCSVMNQIATGGATVAQVAAFLTAMRIKGETVEEMSAAALIMKKYATKVDVQGDFIDIVGTGGDGASTFNISTASTFVCAAAGVKIAKHGSRSASGKIGSADLLEALGVNLNTTAQQEKEIFNKTNLCFMFAQNHHPAMKFVAQARSEIGFRTFFNVLGPLVNPANAKKMLLGVFSTDLCEPMAQTLLNTGVENAFVVCGMDGLDEATVCADTLVCEVKNHKITKYKINPQGFGLRLYCNEDLRSHSLEDNISIIKGVLSGEIDGAKRDIVVFNSALGIYLAGRTNSLQDAVEMAQEVIDKGYAQNKLEEFIKATQEAGNVNDIG